MQTAPKFQLPDQSGAPWALGSKLTESPVVVVFHRGDWCSWCNGQLVSLAREYEKLTSRGARLVAVSVDEPEVNQALVDNLLLPFPVLSDPDGSGAIKTYGVWNEEEEIALPSMFLIGQDGELLFEWHSKDFTDRSPDEDELLELIDQLDLPAVEPEPLERGPAEPSKRRLPLDHIPIYFRGVNSGIMHLLDRIRDGADPIAELEEAQHQAQRFLRTGRQTVKLKQDSA